MAVVEKRRAFQERMSGRDRDPHDRYRAQRAVVEQALNVSKIMTMGKVSGE